MASSLFTGGGVVRFAPSLYGTDDDPVDTAIMRDGVANGLLTMADSFAQVRVNFMSLDAGVATDQNTHEGIESTHDADQYYRVSGSPFGQWPITMQADGTPYYLRYRIAGSVDSVTGSPTATFAIVIAPSNDIASAEARINIGVDSVALATFTTTTPTWDTVPTTRGSDLSKSRLRVTYEEASSWTRSVAVNAYSTTSGAIYSAGAPGAIDQVLVSAHVFAKIDVAARQPQLNALHIAEFVGDGSSVTGSL